MINYLHIENIGIIEDLTVEFERGFNILTGETGAGKTLIIDSLSILSGGKFYKGKISHGKDYGLVEASITIDGVDHVIYRKLNENGKNICKLDSSLITIKDLKNYMIDVIDIHGQKENEYILEKEAQRNLLDRYNQEDEDRNLVSYYNREYADLISLENESERLLNLNKVGNKEESFLKFQINEIEVSEISEVEEKELIEKYEELKNFEKITKSYNELKYNMSNVVPSLSNSLYNIKELSRYKEDLKELEKIIENSYYELEEVSIDIDKESAKLAEYSEEELIKIENRLDIYSMLKKKYGNTVEDILKYLNDCKKQLGKIENLDEQIEKNETAIRMKRRELVEIGKKLYVIRERKAKEISKLINDELKSLEMKSANFNIVVEKTDVITKYGIDEIEYMIRTNLGDDAKKLSDIASGGEMSRIMLAIKKVLADVDNTPIMVFDEIDTGISGVVGKKVGEKMQEIGKKHQVLCVTHLPTIAALGDSNYYIYKKEEKGKTKTYIKKLNEQEVIEEVSRIASGNTKKTSIENAKALRSDKKMYNKNI